ncbi:carbohydrate ABC transporter permease [Planctomonas sp. JC2975]|uniref:carbohydrate ABC transporter permease n=1 Tax=Planctomonas sp. JC2975 TaxID=2729626 RepID=UPI00147436F3|nr:carbohydrate ABC transporter permease [Planctomonas sp. JC2975]NNC13770.1 carbohydrate ABC transporter permease [Planctomonas sp. JC2975]
MSRLSNAIGTTRPRRVAVAIAGWIVAVAFMLPLAWMLFGSFRTETDLFTSQYPLTPWILLPRTFTLSNYTDLLGGGFSLSVWNSIFVTAITVVVGVVVNAMAAFAFTLSRGRGATLLFGFVVLCFLIPFDALAVPLADLFKDWNLWNSYAGLILPGIANGFVIFALRQFFLGIPGELSEAARIDGLSSWGIFWRIYLPLSKPALIAAGFTLFLFQWGAYLWPLLIGTAPDKMLGPIALATLSSQTQVHWGEIFAGAVLLTIVPMVLLLFFQRHFTGSLSTSGSKG